MDANTATQSAQPGSRPAPSPSPSPSPPITTTTSASKRKRAGPSTNTNTITNINTNARTNMSSEAPMANLPILPSTIKPKRTKKSTPLPLHQQQQLQATASALLNDPQTPTDAVQDAEAAAVAALTSGRFQMPSPPVSQSRILAHKPSAPASKNHATSTVNNINNNNSNQNSNEYDLDVDNDEKEIARVEAELAKLENYAPESKRDLSGTTSALSRKMTPEEHALMLLKRKLRNRLSAARSRRRHQLTLAKLQEEIDNLNQYSNRIMEQCENTSAENGVLREENMRLYCENMSLRAHLAAINGSGGGPAPLAAPPQPPISMSLPQYPGNPSVMPLMASVPLNPNPQDPSGNASGSQPSAPTSV
mmetsp:Transcript_69/g.126  ORF Transcript_69/g.126 Transcript_69/m.126 type:complete len:363 (-) Transcript_69:492-1580(-)